MNSFLNHKRTVAELKELRTLTGNEHGAQRLAFTSTWLKARAWLQNKLAELPLKFTGMPQAICGHVARRVGEGFAHRRSHRLGAERRLVDGCLNVMAGVEILRRINAQYNGRPPVTVRLVDWARMKKARGSEKVVRLVGMLRQSESR